MTEPKRALKRDEPCSQNCGRLVGPRGAKRLCPACYQAKRNAALKENPLPCQHPEGCGNPVIHAGNTLCVMHRKRLARLGDVGIPGRLDEISDEERERRRYCERPGCGKLRCKGSALYCLMHRQRVYLHGDPGSPESIYAEHGHPVWSLPDNRRRSERLRKYGLTPDEFDRMLAAQGGRCAICGTADPKNRRGATWCVDHDHTTGAVRGLLCSPCNRGLGMLRDDPVVIAAALEYVKHGAAAMMV